MLDLTITGIDGADADLSREVLPHFGATQERIETDPRDDQEQFDDQRGEQTVTLLQMLGYLEEPARDHEAAGGFSWSGAKINAAWAMWRQDRLALAFSRDPGLTIRTELDTLAVDHPDRLRRDLKACATLEGEVRLTRWPEPGVTSLASRIVLMRLRVYGLCDDIAGVELPASTPLPDGLDLRLRERAARINAKLKLTATGMVDRLGDIGAATTTVQDVLRGNFVVLQSPGSKTGLKRVEGLAPEVAASLGVLDLRSAVTADWNRFSLRLLQVRLWTIGYYRGEIDGDWAQLSHDALERFLKEYGVENPRRLRGTVHDFVVLDIAEVLDVFFRKIDEPIATLDRGDIDGLLKEDKVQGNQELWTKLAGVHEAEKAGAGGEDALPDAKFVGDDFKIASAKNLRRKRYFGWRGVFASFGRFLRKVADKVTDFVTGVLKAIELGLDYVRNLARYIVDASRAFVRVAALAVRRLHCWLTGTPVVSEEPAGAGIVLTLWQRDFDTINIVGTGSPPDLVDRHARVLDWMQRSVAIMLEIGVEVVRTIAAGFGLWLRFAWRLIRTIRTIIEKARDPLFAEILADQATI